MSQEAPQEGEERKKIPIGSPDKRWQTNVFTGILFFILLLAVLYHFFGK